VALGAEVPDQVLVGFLAVLAACDATTGDLRPGARWKHKSLLMGRGSAMASVRPLSVFVG